MKPRRVVLTLEVETDVPLRLLRDKRRYWELAVAGAHLTVLQAQANVVEPWDKEKRHASHR